MSSSPLQTPADVADDYSALVFIVQQLMGRMATCTLVRVKACTNAGGITQAGTVDLQLLVDQVAGDNTTVPAGTVFKAPYVRLMGGSNAVILDPEPGDLGICVFASRDISAIRKAPDAALTRQPSPGAPPGSARSFNYADALYVGGWHNGADIMQYVQLSAAGVKVVSPTAITLQAPTITLDGDVIGTQGAVFTDDVVAEGTSVHTHTHLVPGVQPGGATVPSDPPT